MSDREIKITVTDDELSNICEALECLAFVQERVPELLMARSYVRPKEAAATRAFKNKLALLYPEDDEEEAGSATAADGIATPGKDTTQ